MQVASPKQTLMSVSHVAPQGWRTENMSPVRNQAQETLSGNSVEMKLSRTGEMIKIRKKLLGTDVKKPSHSPLIDTRHWDVLWISLWLICHSFFHFDWSLWSFCTYLFSFFSPFPGRVESLSHVFLWLLYICVYYPFSFQFNLFLVSSGSFFEPLSDFSGWF